ncbi:hypothetical protein H106_03010 [Trichophyton rubrum CBS 735.88]|nr:hypothetical protein H106_03010 [Trichophyton rubrum CBS 735.88]
MPEWGRKDSLCQDVQQVFSSLIPPPAERQGNQPLQGQLGVSKLRLMQTNKSAGVTWRVKLGRQLLQHIRHIRRSDRSDYHVRSGRTQFVTWMARAGMVPEAWMSWKRLQQCVWRPDHLSFLKRTTQVRQ